VPSLRHRNSLCTRMDSRRSRPRCAHVPPRLGRFVLILEMHHPRRSTYPRPPRPRSAERCSECVHTSIRFLWEPPFGSLAKPENDHRGVLGSPTPPLQASLRSLGKSINPHILRSGYVQTSLSGIPGRSKVRFHPHTISPGYSRSTLRVSRIYPLRQPQWHRIVRPHASIR